MRTLQAIVAVLTLVTFSIDNGQAQKNNTVINPKVGVNLSAVDGNLGDLQAAAKVGWNAGVDFRVGGKKLFLSPGLHFNNYTARLLNDIDTDTQVNFKDETTIQALKAPVNIGFDITGRKQLLNLYLKGGVTPTMVLAVNEKAGIPFSKDDLKTFSWGANVGLGMDITILTVDLNYEIGMSDYFANTTGRNNVLTLSAGIRF
ncbi:MAG: outer membrane beta-barrel protein [Haliscomenobacter sp.]|uniref:outer membrane beta-barrel protein n=1 Tax=Haliscomenobacter sp. TaxID=2717303 RepID=UPI0029B9D5FB|nr:outer membrane beta-barrel protein [Haliscomenobacter sp.]MDX2067152.1 outer membrane beta-barrel protein [Haliscomenobacter sp.]